MNLAVAKEIDNFILNNKHSKNKSTFTDMFDLFKTGNKNDDFYNNKVSYIDSPTTYNVDPVIPENMYPNTEFELFKNKNNMKQSGVRRDNTLVINNYYSNEAGQYAKAKTEMKPFFEPFKNENALVGNTKYLDSIDMDRFTQNSLTKRNDFPDNTNIRPESIDGVPLTDLQVRINEKNLDELRGKGVNSIRLDPINRVNKTGLIGKGKPVNPSDINITKFKMKSYRDQNGPDDLLKTTGNFLKPEWRSLVKESDNVILPSPPVGASGSVVQKNEYHNNDMARPTIKEQFVENTYISNSKSVANKSSYYNNNMSNPTIREETSENTYIGNTKNISNKPVYYNNNSSNPTIREDTANNMYFGTSKNISDKSSYYNNNAAKPTIREDTSNTDYFGPSKNISSKSSYYNDMASNPTIREDTSNMEYFGPSKNIADKSSYYNNMASNPTIREDTSENTYIGGNKSIVDKPVYINNMAANPTIREVTENNDYVGGNRSIVARPVYLNNMAANPTIREVTENNEYMGASKNIASKSSYYNNNASNPTIREDTSNNNYFGTSKNISSKSSYYNNNMANPTIREDTSNTEYFGTSKNIASKSFYYNNNIANPTIREDTSNTNYFGTSKNISSKSSYYNNNMANPTIREDTSNTNYNGTSFNLNQGIVYENMQSPRDTNRMETCDNEYKGNSYMEGTYRKNTDETRSGAVEDVLVKDYNGISKNNVMRGESQLSAKNMVINESIETSVNQSQRPLMGGGTDRLSAGKNDVGLFSNTEKREEKNSFLRNRARNVLNNFISEVPPTRGTLLLEQRDPINPFLNISLSDNPFVNNMVHHGLSQVDNLRAVTLLNDRVIDKKTA
jgi:hypothetical protein